MKGLRERVVAFTEQPMVVSSSSAQTLAEMPDLTDSVRAWLADHLSDFVKQDPIKDPNDGFSLNQRIERLFAFLDAADAEFVALCQELTAYSAGCEQTGSSKPKESPFLKTTAYHDHNQNAPETGQPETDQPESNLTSEILEHFLIDQGIEAYWTNLAQEAGFALNIHTDDDGAAARANLFAFLQVSGINRLSDLKARLTIVLPNAVALFRTILALWAAETPDKVPASQGCAVIRLALLTSWPPHKALTLLDAAPFSGIMQGIVKNLLVNGRFAVPFDMAA